METIALYQNENMMHNNVQTMTSLEIAELTGKQHNDLMKAIRKMEPAWEKVQGGKFSLLQKIHQLPRPEWMGFFQIVHLILKKNPFCAETGANFW